MTRERLIALACGLAAVAAAGTAVAAELHWQNGATSALVRVHDRLPLARLAVEDDSSFRLRHDSGFYDGAYFYAIARDPLALARAHKMIEEISYHYGHPLYGWAAAVVSLGRPHYVPEALLAVGFAALLAAGIGASLLSTALGWTAWGGLAVALNPGLIFAATVDTSETLGVALLVLSLLAYLRGRRIWAIVLFALLCLTKEPFAAVVLALAVWELWRLRRPPLSALGVLPAAAWWLYLRIHLGAFPFGQGSDRLAPPFLGWKRAVLDAAAQSWNPSIDAAQLGMASVPLIIAVGLAFVVGAVFAFRLRGPVDIAYLALAAVYACAVGIAYQYPKDLIREPAALITLLPLVIASRRLLRPDEP